MSVTLEGPHWHGDLGVAALVRQRVVSQRIGRAGVAVEATRAPVVLALLRDGAVAFHAPSGRPVSPETAEALCPGVIARLQAESAR